MRKHIVAIPKRKDGPRLKALFRKYSVQGEPHELMATTYALIELVRDLEDELEAGGGGYQEDAMKTRRKGLNEYPVRTCQSSHECVVCKGKISLGESYYDGGYGRRTHVHCVWPKKLPVVPRKETA